MARQTWQRAFTGVALSILVAGWLYASKWVTQPISDFNAKYPAGDYTQFADFLAWEQRFLGMAACFALLAAYLLIGTGLIRAQLRHSGIVASIATAFVAAWLMSHNWR